jgi:hypothetical protein
MWKFTELSQHTENHGVGSLRARFELSNGPGSQGTIATQFNCEGTTLSGAEFELVGPGYRLSLVKRRFVSGKLLILLLVTVVNLGLINNLTKLKFSILDAIFALERVARSTLLHLYFDISGKYICDADYDSKYRYAAPPGPSAC